MNLLKKSFAVAAMALSTVGAAQAASTHLNMDPGTPGVADISFTLGSLTTGPGEFDDFFTFNILDAQDISFAFNSARVGSVFGTTFYGFALYDHNAAVPFEFVLNDGAPHTLSGGIYTLANGTYDLEVAGIYGKTAGSYDGYISGTPAVPEPSGWALLVAGLGVTGLLARRRKQEA